MQRIIEGFHLSPQQKMIWLPQAQSPALCVQCAISLEGNVDRNVLQQALERVTGRHEILRTTFQRLPGVKVPLQVVSETAAPAWRQVQFGNAHHGDLETLLKEERSKSFAFESGPLLRASLISLDTKKHLLVITLPAILADTSTLQQLFAELTDSYAALLDHGEPPEPATQYLQFAQWQNELVEAEEAVAGREFWTQQLRDALPGLQLPFELTPVDYSVFAPDSLELIIEKGTADALAQLAAESNTSVEAVLLACWQTLLFRLSGQSEFIVECLFSGRKYAELENVCGLIASSLPIRASLKRETPFSGVLQDVSDSIVEAGEWQEYFAPSKSSSDEGREDSLAFSFEERPARRDRAAVSFSYAKQYSCLGRRKLELKCFRDEGSLTAEFQFDPARFDSTDVFRIARSFQALLHSVVHDPAKRIGTVGILDPTERQRLLWDLNQTATSYPRDACIHGRFEEQAARTPELPALACGENRMTYASLNARANQLAHFLRRQGIGRGVVVGFCVERSPEMLLGVLAILKAGGAYLPLDPEQPGNRIVLQLEQSRAPIVITERRLRDRLRGWHGVSLLLEDCWPLSEGEPRVNPDCVTTADDLVYIIYTSGSTGVPKGVAITHRSLINYASFICRTLRLADAPGLHFALVSTLSADLGNTVIYPALISGGCLHVLSREIASDGTLFANYFSRNPIDVLKIVPSHLNALLDDLEDERVMLPRRYLVLGGEGLSRDLIERLEKRGDGLHKLNHYGPTETTVGSLTYPLDRNAIPSRPLVPIGRPIANTQVYVLDEFMQPVPAGVVGELYIGGDGLAQGYLHEARQTAERFVPNPFSSESGARLYKTGDLVRYLPDGNIEFLGRADQQVKLHGFRIELGEIEAALLAHPAVHTAVVIAREDKPGHKRLVAYVVSQPPASLSGKELRSFLKDELPDYMTPYSFVVLKTLPLTANGKVDRNALPEPEQFESERAFLAASTPIEKTLAGIWEEVLGVKPIGTHDNFFELGGDSILSIQIITRANRTGLRLMPKQLFEHPTIAELATVAKASAPLEIEQGLVTGRLPLTPIQHWFFSQDLPEPAHWNMAVLLEMHQYARLPLLENAFAKLLLHHDALRLRFVKTSDGWTQFHEEEPQPAAVSRFDLSHLPVKEQSRRIETTADSLQASLNLSDGPSLRAALFELGNNLPARLLIVVHHLVMDGVSLRILLEDLATACDQLSRGQEVVLPLKTTSFKHWSEFLSDYAQSPELLNQLDYWLAQTPPSGEPLRADSPGGADIEASTRSVTVSLSAEETGALLHAVPEVYHTQINDVLLTALLQAWVAWSGATELLVDLEGHGREELAADMDLSRTVGWFTTHYPVRLRLRDPANLKESLMTIKEQLRRIPQNGIGYGLLRYLNESETTAPLRSQETPFVSFNYLGQFDRVLDRHSMFSMAQEPIGALKSLRGKRSHPIRVNGSVMKGQLQVAFAYSENVFRQLTIEGLAREFINALRSLIKHCQSSDAGGYTSSDFPEADVSQAELDKLLARFSQTARS